MSIEHAGGTPEVGFEGRLEVGSWTEESFAVRITGFDYGAVERGLGEAPGEVMEDWVWRMASEALARVIDWIHLDGKGKANGVLIRAHVVAQLVRPGLFGNVTDVELCRRLGVHKQAFGEDKSDFRDRFGFLAFNMRSEAGRQAMREAYRTREALGKRGKSKGGSKGGRARGTSKGSGK